MSIGADHHLIAVDHLIVRLPGAGTADEAPPTAGRFTLALDGPNPARGTIRVALTLPTAQALRVDAFDVQGRRVATLAEGTLGAGRHRLASDAAHLPAGVYAVRATAAVETTVLHVTTVR